MTVYAKDIERIAKRLRCTAAEGLLMAKDVCPECQVPTHNDDERRILALYEFLYTMGW